jgi:aminocarboxymuconate-semialdehyde decarboxylase
MKIDIFAHIMPRKYEEALDRRFGRKFITVYAPALTDLEQRFRIMDAYQPLRQVVTIPGPALAEVMGPEESPEFARMANDILAEVVNHHPDRFAGGVANLPMNNIDAALKETDRAIKELGFKGILLHTPSNGKALDLPELMPLYEKMAQYDLPIWIHPRRGAIPDYEGEEKSLYWAFSVWGWPYETTLAMTRLVFSGIFDRYPKLKFIIHHAGAMVPFFERRIYSQYEHCRVSGLHQYGHLASTPVEYFRRFYCDTAVNGSTPALMCAYHFFGVDQLLFGTDAPMDAENGHMSIRETIRSIEEMDIPDAERQEIYEGNARRLLHLSP